MAREFKQTRKFEGRGICFVIFKEGEDEEYIFNRFPIRWFRRNQYVS